MVSWGLHCVSLPEIPFFLASWVGVRGRDSFSPQFFSFNVKRLLRAVIFFLNFGCTIEYTSICGLEFKCFTEWRYFFRQKCIKKL